MEVKKIGVLFVCTGNICRSPMAHGLFQHMIKQHALEDQIYVDSAGTIPYHSGHGSDPRAQETALAKGIDISHLRARQVRDEDFETFNYILAMDRDNVAYLHSVAPQVSHPKIRLLLSYAPQLKLDEVPDPYYGARNGFERVWSLLDAACVNLLSDLKREKI